jgi:hypothetical protein
MTHAEHVHQYDSNGDRHRCPLPACWWNSQIAEWLSGLVEIGKSIRR